MNNERDRMDRTRDVFETWPGDRSERSVAFERLPGGHVAIIGDGYRECPLRTLSPLEVRRLVWWLDRRSE